MKRQWIHGMVAGVVLFGFGAAALAYDQDRDRARDQAREQQQIRDQDIYGWQLMTTQEREEYRARMRAARTLEEREQIRTEHHERMKARAKERGMGPGGGMDGGRNR